jgi:hypothetical protein
LSLGIFIDDNLDYYLWIGWSMLSMFTTVLVLLSTWKNRMRWLLLPWLVMQIASLMALCSGVLYLGVILITVYDPLVTLICIFYVCVGGVVAGIRFLRFMRETIDEF